MLEQVIFAALLAVAAAAVVIGCAMVGAALAWIVGGVCLAGAAWLLFGDVE
jgi:hypothetical protein